MEQILVKLAESQHQPQLLQTSRALPTPSYPAAAENTAQPPSAPTAAIATTPTTPRVAPRPHIYEHPDEVPSIAHTRKRCRTNQQEHHKAEPLCSFACMRCSRKLHNSLHSTVHCVSTMTNPYAQQQTVTSLLQYCCKRISRSARRPHTKLRQDGPQLPANSGCNHRQVMHRK